jgi:anhydro-N-acetylmuramic acid kinase
MRLRLFEPRPRASRLGRGRSSSDVRRFIGLSAGARSVQGALIAVSGHGLAASAACIEEASLSLVDADRASDDERTDAAIDIACQLASRAGDERESIRAIGLADSLAGADCARLAAATGLAVIDDFPAADRAKRGAGAPLSPLPLWLFVGDRTATARGRLLWELGRESRFTLLPPVPLATESEEAIQRIRHAAGPGTRVIDWLTETLTGGAELFDHGGNFGAQGRVRVELAPSWESVVRSEEISKPEIASLAEAASGDGYAVHDIICTATHILATELAEKARHWLAAESELDLILTGGGRKNGLLLREIMSLLPGVELRTLSAVGLRDCSLAPVVAALLAMLHVDQAPANLPHLTGAESVRLLGRITPGSPPSWRRLLSEMAARSPQTLKLRAAI